MDSRDVFEKADELVAREIDNEFLIVDLNTGQFHMPNGAGSYIWSCIDGILSLGQVSERLQEEFPDAGLSDDIAYQHVMEFTTQLLDAGLIKKREAG